MNIFSLPIIGAALGLLLVGAPLSFTRPTLPTLMSAVVAPILPDRQVATPVTPMVRAMHVREFDGRTPMELLVPRLGIAAAVQPVGTTAVGVMGTPSGKRKYRDVGWYKAGPAPGESGNAVIAGHLDNGFGFSAVFRDLEILVVGDVILTKTADGKELHFVVEKVVAYDNNAAAAQEVFQTSGPSKLVLITCTGDWQFWKMQYTKRLAVYASLLK